ncbi:MAG: shikimate dehydrogenase [Verrucomicrobiales bacterium]
MAKDLNFKQELTACFGFPVAENPTQAMIEPAYSALGLDWRYLPLEVKPEDLATAVPGARAFGFRGFNCTIPHKVAVIEHLDGLGESASLMGAVNCVVNRDGKLIGENTDGKGFVSSLGEMIDPAGKSVVIFGAGGASRAISVELALAGVTKITLVNRDPERGSALNALLRGAVKDAVGGSLETEFIPWENDYSIPAGTDIVINATSIGLYPDVDARLALDTSSLGPDMIVADVIPNPPQTNLVKDATAAGCKVIDGLAMLVAQGVIGIEYWAGQTPDPAIMRAGLEEVFG